MHYDLAPEGISVHYGLAPSLYCSLENSEYLQVGELHPHSVYPHLPLYTVLPPRYGEGGRMGKGRRITGRLTV